ncbi:MAG: rRNA maturation RNase YbeY [Roseococcus sp.]|nr:rRNA maturation RNase YbeY [Roseococcus sp.]
MSAGPVVEVVFGAPGWRAALPRVERLARRCVAAALADQGATGHLTLLLTDDAEIRRLNAGFRGREKATNVLSFPAPYGALTLGDLAVSLGVLRREAAAEGRPLAAHFAHLVVHGTLHLLGHDHQGAGEAVAMERAEARILRRLGLPNPWRARWRMAA